ncbi:LysE/ArgO family amino acid transporter [Solwaraspora sp. WMMD1047]|uniref:LysE/ArgO family amino acid transporter n=1 Tax=Solwaraspora sp. WMMD1047 TaxID=3016102 RepID=UPI0024167016|nr:LysE/ArgO family amino acid transporter [Solwaraspora sp. WMMD1047]MDG4832155.1 LysE/ArgO family amino acid transporter [Solwaraspora sp. WMMD1047]
MITGTALAVVAGLGFGLSLIVAIGAQNAFVLRQGLRREHVGPVVAVCAVSDAALIVAGVAGVGALVTRSPLLLDAIRYAGAAFLVGYGLLAARRAVRPSRLAADPGGERTGLRGALLTCLALTWLNPHVYLDTVLLLGAVASARPAADRWWFAGGAVLASLLWFGVLGYGARLLRPIFASPTAWRILDAAIALTMIAIAIGLLVGG